MLDMQSVRVRPECLKFGYHIFLRDPAGQKRREYILQASFERLMRSSFSSCT